MSSTSGKTSQHIADSASSSGPVLPFDTSFTPVVLYNASLTDSSGNGHDMVVVAGTVATSEIYPGTPSLFVDNGSTLRVAGTDSQYQIIGDVTIMATIRLNTTPGSFQGIIFCGNGNAGSANNHSYLCQVRAFGTPPRVLRFFWENGAGVDQDFDSDGTDSLPPLHAVMQCAWVRNGNVGQMFVNGVPFGDASTGLTAPTGGSGGVLQIGGVNNTTAPISTGEFEFASIQVIASALSNAQILAEYNRTMGPAYGTRS